MKSFSPKAVFKNLIKSNVDVVEYSTVSIDSRNVCKNGIFFALKGEHTDGHLFIENALKNGFSYAVISNSDCYEKYRKMPLILVEDTFGALNDLAMWNLSIYRGEKIVITGSVGKTSTKALAKAVLGQRFKVYEAFKNFNNELGIPIVASNIEFDSEYAVFEIGTNSQGEIKRLAALLRPDIAIITNIGHAHIGRFGDFRALTEEKLSVLEFINPKGELWLNDEIDTSGFRLRGDIKIKYFGEKYSSDVILEEISHGTDEGFIVKVGDARYKFAFNHPYEHFIYNLLPVIGIAFEKGMHYEEIYRGILSFRPVDGRGNIINIDGFTIIDDTYNAGFEAMLSSIKNLDRIDSENKSAIIGEMAEIEGFEDELYKRLYKVIEEMKDITFHLCGENFKTFIKLPNVIVYSTKEELIKSLNNLKKGVYLVKAARGKKFEDVVNKIKSEALSAL